MPSLLDVARRPAAAADQKVTQPDFRAGQIVLRIHRSKNVVVGHLRVERMNQPLETLFSDAAVVLLDFHQASFSSARRAASCSASFFVFPVAAPSTSPRHTTSMLNILR